MGSFWRGQFGRSVPIELFGGRLMSEVTKALDKTFWYST